MHYICVYILERDKHACSPKIQSSFPKQWFPGVYLLLGCFTLLLTCQQNFKSEGKDFTVKTWCWGRWAARFSGALLGAGGFCSLFPGNGVFPFNPPSDYTNLHSPSPHPTASKHFTNPRSSLRWRGGKRQRRVCRSAKRGTQMRGLAQLQWTADWASRAARQRPAQRPPSRGSTHTIPPNSLLGVACTQEPALGFGYVNGSTKGVASCKGARYSFAKERRERG